MDVDTLSEGERGRIRQELERSGYPLEHRVAMICQQAFSSPLAQGGPYERRDDGVYRQGADGAWTRVPPAMLRRPAWPGDSASWSDDRLVYRDARKTDAHPEGMWREVDRVLDFQTFADLGAGPEDAVIGLGAQAIIECKHREDVLLVGFQEPDRAIPPVFPIFGPMARTRLIASLGGRIANPCATLPRVTVGAVQKKGSGWHSFGEAIIHNAAGSLYDYLVADWRPWATTAVHPFLETAGITESLASQLNHPFFSLEGWIHHNVTMAWCETFNAQHVRWNVIPPLMLTLPIVCVDMPLALTTVDEHGQVAALTSASAFIVEERVHAWPGRIGPVLYTPARGFRRAPSAPVVVVHSDHLMDILIALAEWCTAWYNALTSTPPQAY